MSPDTVAITVPAIGPGAAVAALIRAGVPA